MLRPQSSLFTSQSSLFMSCASWQESTGQHITKVAHKQKQSHDASLTRFVTAACSEQRIRNLHSRRIKAVQCSRDHSPAACISKPAPLSQLCLICHKSQDWHAILMHLIVQQAPWLASRNVVEQQHGALHQSTNPSEIECCRSIGCSKINTP